MPNSFFFMNSKNMIEESPLSQDLNEDDGSYNSSEELMAPALPIYDENDSEGGIQNETLKEAYDFLKKGFKYFKKIRQTFYIGRIEAQAIDKSKLVFESSNIKVNPVKIPKDYQRIHEKLPDVFISNNLEWKQTVLDRFQNLKNVFILKKFIK